MTKAETLELEIRRENLLRKNARLSDIIDACKIATRCATKHKRLAIDTCNGLPKEWNPARIDRQMKDCRDKAHKALKSILVPGLEYDFRNDHVYCMVRIRDKANRRAFAL